MNPTLIHTQSGLSELKLFFALSRTPHGLPDMATPALAAVFAVDPQPSFPPLILLSLWLFFWEIGGQNTPNDWADIEEDRILQATTIPVRFGPVLADGVIFFSLLLAVILNGISVGLPPVGTRFAGVAASLGAGIYLLLIPAYRLYRTKGRMQALALFNSASYYPITWLAVVIIAACTRCLKGIT